jgi:hypothetical protein
MIEKALIAVKCLFEAIEKFYDDDFCEFNSCIKGMERSCAFRIGSYFREKIKCKCDFEGYHVDMEYNRQQNKIDNLGQTTSKLISDPKKYKEESAKEDDIKKKRIIPDLILHKRGESCNILVCEFKILEASKTSSVYKKIANDICKLKFMTTQNCKDCEESTACGYKVGIFIGLHKNSKSKNKYILFCNQKKLCGSIYSPCGCLTQKAIGFIKCQNS